MLVKLNVNIVVLLLVLVGWGLYKKRTLKVFSGGKER